MEIQNQSPSQTPDSWEDWVWGLAASTPVGYPVYPVLVSPSQSCPRGILGSPVSCALAGLPRLGEAPLIL